MAASIGGRIARGVARAPIKLYEAGHGHLLGQRFLMLEHTGRVSGLARHVVVEVVEQLPGNRFVIPSGRGEKADWYRNIRAEPRVRVSLGRRQRIPAVARPLDHDEARTLLQRYRARRPGTWRFLRPVISRVLGHPGQTDDELFDAVSLVELTLERDG